MARLFPIMFLLATSVAAGIGAAQDQLISGPWTVTFGPLGPMQIAYQGEPVFRKGDVGGYLPAWQGGRFNMDDCRVTRLPNKITWSKSVAGNQSATMTLDLRPNGFRFGLETTIHQPGPTEFSLEILPEAVRANQDYCMVWVDGNLSSLPLGWPFDTVRGVREMRFERPDRTVTVKCSWMDMQDRRADSRAMFLVQVINPSVGFPAKVSSFVDCEVTPANPADVAGREVLFSQLPEELIPLEVPNSGFEAGREGWSENPLSALDSQVARSGSNSVRLSITKDQTQAANPYVTQMIPVQPKHLYQAEAWVRTQDVDTAAIGDRHSTGATVIMEFADTQGRWLASGSYAQGLYGSKDWTQVVGAPARAPEGAGYATIFLTLRGTGTAWFDDVGLREVRKNVLPLAPLPGAEVADNTPTFHWYCGWKGPSVLELSRDPAFPPGQTISRRLSGLPPVTLDQPIPPGKWLWRVQVPEVGLISPAWSLAQTAPVDRDTTQPVIAERHGFLRSATQPVTVRFSDNVAVTAVSLTVDGQAVHTVQASAAQARYVPPRGWSPGLHKVGVTARDAAGNSATRQLFLTYSPPMPTITWERVGGVTENGRKRFLFGLYGVHEPDFAEVAAAGFDFVHSYQWDGAATDAEAVAYLNEAQRHGLRAFIGINRQRLMKGDEEFVAERVGALMGHPGLFAWYLYDEPDLDFQYVSPEMLTRYYRLIKALDPFHPVVVTCAGDSAVPLYRNACDVYWMQAYGAAPSVADRMARTRGYLRPGKPMMTILHCYDATQTEMRRLGQPVDPTKFQPDALTLRGNAFLAVVHGSSCLNWWEYEKQSPQFYSVGHVPEALAALKQAIADLKTLEPVITADGETRRWVEKPAEGREVHCWEKRLADRTVLIAVNRDREPCELALTSQFLPANGAVEVLFEGRRATVREGRLQDRFGPLEVHVYEGRGTVGGEGR